MKTSLGEPRAPDGGRNLHGGSVRSRRDVRPQNMSDAPSKETVSTGDAARQPPPPSADKTIVLARRVFPEVLPVIALPHRPGFPRMTIPLVVTSSPLQELLVQISQSRERYAGLVLLRRPPQQGEETPAAPSPAELYAVGVVAELLQLGRPSPEAPLHALFGVHERFRIAGVVQESPHLRVRAEYLIETEMADNPELKAYSVALVKSIKELIQLNPLHKEELALYMSQT